MRKLIVMITALLMTVLLQACGSAGAAGTGGTGYNSLGGSAGTGSDAAPTTTFTGFAVVQVDGALSGKVVAFFSEDMDPATINAQNFTVTGPDQKPIAGKVEYIGVTAVYTPDQRFTAETAYTATLSDQVRSASGVPMAQAKVFHFTTPDPSALTGVLVRVASSAPAANEMNVPLNAGVNATFNQVMDPATVNESTFRVLDPSGASVAGNVHYTGVTASFVPVVPLSPNTTYRAVVSSAVSNLAGVNMDNDQHWSFTTGTSMAVQPQVVYTAPLQSDSNISANSTVVVDFNEAMDTNTVNTSNIVVANSQGWPVAGSVTYAAQSAVFTPDAPLSPSETYTVSVSGNVASAGGTQMGQAYSWTFTTAAFGGAVAPTVVFTNPSQYQSSVWTNATVSVAFSAVIDPVTLNTGTFQVTDQAGNPVAGSVSYLGNVAIFTPASVLAYGTQYTVTLTSGITGVDGAALVSYSWSFTTTMPM